MTRQHANSTALVLAICAASGFSFAAGMTMKSSLDQQRIDSDRALIRVDASKESLLKSYRASAVSLSAATHRMKAWCDASNADAHQALAGARRTLTEARALADRADREASCR